MSLKFWWNVKNQGLDECSKFQVLCNQLDFNRLRFPLWTSLMHRGLLLKKYLFSNMKQNKNERLISLTLIYKLIFFLINEGENQKWRKFWSLNKINAINIIFDVVDGCVRKWNVLVKHEKIVHPIIWLQMYVYVFFVAYERA